MNAIDKSRVVGIDDRLLDNFLCPICWKVLTEPMVTQCCRQTYCKTCIIRWLNERHVCPEDGRPLRPSQLVSAPTLVTTLVNSLSVKCLNYGKGCPAVVRRDLLDRHLEECRHRYEEISRIQPILYEPSCSADNAVNYEFWLEFRLRQVLRDGIRIRKKDVTLLRGDNDNSFVAIFDKNDIDFEIQVENTSEHNICFKVKADNQLNRNCFVVRKGMTSSVKALDTSGRQLHYNSQTRSDNPSVIAMRGHSSRAWIPKTNCSKLDIKVYIELGNDEYQELLEYKRKCKLKEKRSVMEQKKSSGTRISVTVGLEDKVVRLNAFNEDKIALLKHLIEDNEGIPVDEQRLVFDGKVLRNELTIRDYNIPFNAHLELITDQTSCADPKMSVAERGVICFGANTDQRLMAYNRPFVKSNKYLVQGFVIQLTTKSNH